MPGCYRAFTKKRMLLILREQLQKERDMLLLSLCIADEQQDLHLLLKLLQNVLLGLKIYQKISNNFFFCGEVQGELIQGGGVHE